MEVYFRLAIAGLQTLESIPLPRRRCGNSRFTIVQIRKELVFGLLESDGNRARETKPKDKPNLSTLYQGLTIIIAHLRETKEHSSKTETNNAFPESLRRTVGAQCKNEAKAF